MAGNSTKIAGLGFGGGSGGGSSTVQIPLFADATLSYPSGINGGSNVTGAWTGQSVNQLGTSNDFFTSITCVGATIIGGGSGYSVGNILTMSGGTLYNAAASAATFIVTAVSSGAVTAVSPCSGSTVVANSGSYTILPGTPSAGAGTTGGGGSACTLLPIGALLLPAGTYTCNYKMTTCNQNGRCRLYNYTDGLIIYDSQSPNISNWSGTAITTLSGGVTKMTFSATKAVGLQYFAAGSTGGNDRGVELATSDGALEIYTHLQVAQLKTFPSARSVLTRWFNGSYASKTINCYGDSTLHVTIAGNFYSYLQGLPGMSGVTLGPYGDNGQTSVGFWANTAAHGQSFAQATPGDLALWGYGLNDERTGGDAGGATLYANTMEFIASMASWWPNTDIILLMPNVIGSYDTGAGYVVPNASYQYYNNLIRQAYLNVMAQNPAHTWLVDCQTLITGVLGHVDPDYLTADQLHPSVLGYNMRATAVYNAITT